MLLLLTHNNVKAADGHYKHKEDASDHELGVADKLEVLCIATLLAVYALGVLSASTEPAEGSGLSSIVSAFAVLTLLFPVGGALFMFRRHDVDLAYIVGAAAAKQADLLNAAADEEGKIGSSPEEPKPRAKAEPAAAEDTLPGAIAEP